MGARPRDSIRHFMRIAGRRLDAARFILDAARLKEGPPEALANVAIENAAMAEECALKGLILESTPTADRPETEASFRGSNPHRFEWLKDRLSKRGVSLPRPVVQSLARMSWWEYERRYDLQVIPTERATEFLTESGIVVNWVRERI